MAFDGEEHIRLETTTDRFGQRTHRVTARGGRAERRVHRIRETLPDEIGSVNFWNVSSYPRGFAVDAGCVPHEELLNHLRFEVRWLACVSVVSVRT
jgi:hypothetical protein